MCEFNDNYIINFFNNFNKRFRWDRLQYKYKDIFSYLINRYNDSDSPKESYYRILNNLENRPVCKICGNKVKFNIRNGKFDNTCSKECTNKLRWKKIKQFNIQYYGVENYYSSNKFKENQKQKNLEKYNVEYTFQRTDIREKIKQTCLERYGVENGGASKQAQEKIKQTTKEHFGVENSLSSPIIREKIKQTCLERYGVENGGASKQAQEKIKQTTKEHFGVENSLSSPIIREKIKQTCLERYGGNSPWSSKEIINKAKENAIKKYGVDCWQKTEEGRKYLSNKISSIEVQEKINNTKRKNHTFNTSKHEKYIESILKDYFPKLKTQYKDNDKYPFKCDFYIPEIDTWIEYNGTWTHGGKLFEGNKEDNLKLQKWINKSKTNKYYKTAIYVWTKLDLEKYKYAKQNKLKYIIFWNLNEFDNWIINL